jgi:hypothetical protein
VNVVGLNLALALLVCDFGNDQRSRVCYETRKVILETLTASYNLLETGCYRQTWRCNPRADQCVIIEKETESDLDDLRGQLSR